MYYECRCEYFDEDDFNTVKKLSNKIVKEICNYTKASKNIKDECGEIELHASIFSLLQVNYGNFFDKEIEALQNCYFNKFGKNMWMVK